MPSPFSARELKPNSVYRVVAEFIDFDGKRHSPGERWRYLSESYFPYDAGFTLYVEIEGKEGSIRLQDYPEAQGPVIDRFSEFVVEEESA